MKFTKIPDNTFQNLQLNAGILCQSFNPATGEVSNILGATSGGVNFQDSIEYTDFGDDIDNCPKNMMELKKLDSHDVQMSGTFVTVDVSTAKMLAGAADISGTDDTKIIPRNDLRTTDFADLWWVGDYSNVNTGATAGFIAIHMLNVLNTGGFQIQSTDNGKGQFAFTFSGHYSMSAQDTVPYEIYVKSGTASVQPSIYLNKHALTLVDETSETLVATSTPANATVTWTSASTTTATVSNGLVTGKNVGNTIITAAITVDGVTYNDTCTVIVTAAGA